MNERNYVRTMQLLGEVEQFIQELSFDLPCTVACDKISIGGVIRSAGIEILDDYGDDLLSAACRAVSSNDDLRFESSVISKRS